jgi:hypothetical protein
LIPHRRPRRTCPADLSRKQPRRKAGKHDRLRLHNLASQEDTMQKFTTLTGIAAVLPMINVDTDMIIPK